MANASVSELILFIAALTVAAGVATTLTASVTDISNVVSERGSGVAQKIGTEIEVINDPGSPGSIYNRSGNENVTLLVKNTGAETLPADPDRIDVLVDGTFQSVANVTVVGGASDWGRGDVVRLTVERALSPGEHRAVVIVNEDREVLRFRVA